MKMNTHPQSEPVEIVLTPKDCLRPLWSQVAWVVFLLALAFPEYETPGTRLWSLLPCVGALNFLVGLVRVCRLYVAVKSGAVIRVQREIAATPTVVPTALSAVVVIVLTVVVMAVSFVSVMLLSHTRPALWWLLVVAVNGALWFYAIFCWHRLSPAPQKLTPAPPTETDHAAWPPPPSPRPGRFLNL